MPQENRGSSCRGETQRNGAPETDKMSLDKRMQRWNVLGHLRLSEMQRALDGLVPIPHCTRWPSRTEADTTFNQNHGTLLT